MLKRVWTWLKARFAPVPVRLAIVRRYTDANGSYVGELYVEEQGKNYKGFTMIGASLDTLPFDMTSVIINRPFYVNDSTVVVVNVDTSHDFLDPMPKYIVRVGALNPSDNDTVRYMVAKMPRRGMRLIIQNRFIESVMERA